MKRIFALKNNIITPPILYHLFLNKPSEKAALVNIAIMRAFVAIRKSIALQSNLSQEIMAMKNDLEQRLGEHDVQLMEIYTVMEQFLEEKTKQKEWESRKKLGYK